MTDQFDNFERIFNPESVAVVGVSTKGYGFGAGILFALNAIGYEGRLYPVGSKEGELNGMKVYAAIEDIPGSIDFAIIAVPAPGVPEALDACRKKGAAGAEILSSGFSEVNTPEGDELDRQVKEIAAKGIRVIGPNCFGIYSPKSGLTMLPGGELSRKPGPVAFLAQSGGLAIDFGYLGKWRGFNFSKMLSFGNGCDLRETEMLRYLRQDPETKVICMYIEGITDGSEFFKELSKTTMEKPVIVLKGGLSDSGARAVASHTASMGGSRKIWASALKQCNAVQVNSLQEMADAALAFSMLPLREYHGLTVVGGGGALGVNGADLAEPLGFSTPALRDDIQEKILPVLPQPGSSAVNPIDIANPMAGPDIIHTALTEASQDDNIQIHLLIQLLHSFKSVAAAMGVSDLSKVVPLTALVEACTKAVDKGGKPVVLALPNNKQEMEAMDIEAVIREARQMFLLAGIPVYERVDDALKAIAAVSGYAKRREAIAKSL